MLRLVVVCALVAIALSAPTWTSQLGRVVAPKAHLTSLTGSACTTNFGPVPGFYESGSRKYVAIESSQHASQANNQDLISAAACLTSRTSCEYTTGTYGLRLTGSQQNPAYQNNDQAHTCLNDLTGTTNFYQRTTNGYTYIFATSDSAMTSLNTALASAPSSSGSGGYVCQVPSASGQPSSSDCPSGSVPLNDASVGMTLPNSRSDCNDDFCTNMPLMETVLRSLWGGRADWNACSAAGVNAYGCGYQDRDDIHYVPGKAVKWWTASSASNQFESRTGGQGLFCFAQSDISNGQSRSQSIICTAGPNGAGAPPATLPPTENPTPSPTPTPSEHPTTRPPSPSPSHTPTESPTPNPTPSPTEPPSRSPTDHPTTLNPTRHPTTLPPTSQPTENPTPSPTPTPTEHPTTRPPSPSPSHTPTESPTVSPTPSPTEVPSQAPTASPTPSPTRPPTRPPTYAPTAIVHNCHCTGCDSHFKTNEHVEKSPTLCGEFCDDEPNCRFSLFNSATTKCYLYDQSQVSQIKIVPTGSSIYTCYTKYHLHHGVAGAAQS